MAEQWVSSLGDDIPNRGKVGLVDNFCVSDKFMPAYPEDFNFLSEISIFNNLLIFTWHDIAFCAESAIKHQPTNN